MQLYHLWRLSFEVRLIFPYPDQEAISRFGIYFKGNMYLNKKRLQQQRRVPPVVDVVKSQKINKPAPHWNLSLFFQQRQSSHFTSFHAHFHYHSNFAFAKCVTAPFSKAKYLSHMQRSFLSLWGSLREGEKQRCLIRELWQPYETASQMQRAYSMWQPEFMWQGATHINWFFRSSLKCIHTPCRLLLFMYHSMCMCF